MRYVDETEDMELEVAESQSNLHLQMTYRIVEMNCRFSPQNLNSRVLSRKEYWDRSVSDSFHKDVGISVDRVRVAIRWVRQSPARLKRFKEFAIMDNIVCQNSLCLDVPTRWNSTYLMLSVAIEYEKVFDRFSEEDYVFMRDLGEGPRVPTSNDWANVRRTKIEYIQVTLNGMYGDDEGPKVAELCEKALIALFNDYKRIYSNQNVRSVSSSLFDDATQSFSISQSVTDRDSKSELDRYLTEEIEGDEAYFKSGDFTVLGWWKRRSPAFPVLLGRFSVSGDVAVNLEENIDDLEKFKDEMGTTSNASNGEDERSCKWVWMLEDGHFKLIRLLSNKILYPLIPALYGSNGCLLFIDERIGLHQILRVKTRLKRITQDDSKETRAIPSSNRIKSTCA
ncbi:zinc finger BED domain-containing protein RICESLEEPER 2-like protein [Tanacetum coccineum]